MGREVGHILGEIAEDEMRQGRPLLSVVAVGVSGLPGPGFAGLARSLGKLETENADDEMAFWEAERTAVYEAWARQF